MPQASPEEMLGSANRLATLTDKQIYRHLDMMELWRHLKSAIRIDRRVIIVIGGTFGMCVIMRR